MDTIPSFNKLSIKSACTRIENETENKVFAIPAHICYDFDGDDYNTFIEIINQNNFAELRMIGHIDESYKQTNFGKVGSFLTIAILIISGVSAIIYLLSLFL